MVMWFPTPTPPPPPHSLSIPTVQHWFSFCLPSGKRGFWQSNELYIHHFQVHRWSSSSLMVTRLFTRNTSQAYSNIVSSSGCGHAAWPFFIHDTFTIIFEIPSSIVDDLLYQNVVYVLCWKSTIYFRLSYTFSPIKTGQSTCCSLVDTKRKVAMLMKF